MKTANKFLQLGFVTFFLITLTACAGNPLTYAALTGDTDAINTLLVKGVQVDTQDSHGNTPLILASLRGHTNAV